MGADVHATGCRTRAALYLTAYAAEPALYGLGCTLGAS
jgi:hypothetical protein